MLTPTVDTHETEQAVLTLRKHRKGKAHKSPKYAEFANRQSEFLKQQWASGVWAHKRRKVAE